MMQNKKEDFFIALASEWLSVRLCIVVHRFELLTDST